MAADPVRRTRRLSWAPNLTVLQGIDRGRLWRDPLFGDLGPWMLDDRVVSSWSIAVLVLRGLVCLDISAYGCPRLTVKGGRRCMDPTDLQPDPPENRTIRTVMARAGFAGELRSLQALLVAMTSTAADAIGEATTALLDRNRVASSRTATLADQLEIDRAEVERRTFYLLARQQPVAGDLRLIVSGIKIGSDCLRMGTLARHIGSVASRAYPQPAVPDDVVSVFRRMGAVAGRIADGAAVTLDARDAQDAARLEVDDDAMDGLLRVLFRRLVDGWPHGVESAVNVALLGRFYERFADHAVAISQSVVYIVTGDHAVPGGRR